MRPAAGGAEFGDQAALALGHPRKGDLHESIGDLLLLAGEYSDAIASYEAALALLASEDRPGVARKLAGVHQRLGEWETASAYLESALEGPPESQAAELRAAVLADMAYIGYRTGDSKGAFGLAERALALVNRGEHPLEVSHVYNVLSILERDRGDQAQARRHLEACLEITEGERTYAPARVAALNNLALIQRGAGELEEAITSTSEALALCRQLGDRHREAALLNNLADLHHMSGQEDESIRFLKQAVVIFSEIGDDRQAPSPEIWMLTDW